MSKKKSKWNKLSVEFAINIDIDGDFLIPAMQKFIARLKKNLPKTIVPLCSRVTALSAKELLVVAMSQKG